MCNWKCQDEKIISNDVVMSKYHASVFRCVDEKLNVVSDEMEVCFCLYLKNATVCEFVAEKRLLCISVRNFSPIF